MNLDLENKKAEQKGGRLGLQVDCEKQGYKWIMITRRKEKESRKRGLWKKKTESRVAYM